MRKKIDELTYRSYAFNRTSSPSISPEKWVAIFGEEAVAMEARYQKEGGVEGRKDVYARYAPAR